MTCWHEYRLKRFFIAPTHTTRDWAHEKSETNRSTSSEQVRYSKSDPDEPQTPRHHLDNEMMATRWCFFNLSSQISNKEQISDIPKCKKCFA